MAVEEEPSFNILNANNLVLLVVLAFPMMSLLNNQLLRSKPFLWWLRRPTKMEERVKGEEEEDFDCVICLSEVLSGEKFRVLPKCKHRFHGGCIDAWLETGQWSCPVCRSPVSPPDHRNGGEERSSGDGGGDWFSLAVEKFCSRFLGSEIMVALSYQERYFYTSIDD